jgi:hypothetical protein
MKKSLILTFWALVGTFILIVGEFFIQAVGELFEDPLFFLLPIIVFSLLGAVLIFLTLKQKVEGVLKKYLLLTGISAVGFFISIFLHNVIYGLFIYLFGSDFWTRIAVEDEPLFFMIAVFVCPVGFLVGAIGSVVKHNSSRKSVAEKATRHSVEKL